MEKRRILPESILARQIHGHICHREERSHIFQTQTPLLLLALRLLLLLQLHSILKLQLRLVLIIRKLPSNSYQKDSVYCYIQVFGLYVFRTFHESIGLFEMSMERPGTQKQPGPPEFSLLDLTS